jgi:hypothetical protein
LKKHRIAALTTGLVVAAIATVFAVLPAAAAFKAERSAAVSSIHRPAQVGAAASPSTLFRSRLFRRRRRSLPRSELKLERKPPRTEGKQASNTNPPPLR